MSKLVEGFKAAKTADERSGLAFAIASGKDKATSAVPLLAASLKDKDRLVRANIARALRTMGPAAKAAVPDLIAALSDSEVSVRAEVMYALGSIGPDAKAAIPLLCEVVKNSAGKGELRTAAALSLGGFGAEAKGAVPLLTDTLMDKDGGLRVASATALYNIDKGNAKVVVPVLRESLKDEVAQTEAVIALKDIGPDAKDAVPELIAVLAKGGMAAYYAREALGKIPASEAALVGALSSPDKKLQQAAAGVLVEYFPEAAKKAGLSKK